MSKGCTIGLIILGIIVLLILIALIVVWINKDKIVEAGINYMSDAFVQEISKDLPPGYTREAVQQVVTDFQAGIKTRKVGPEAVQAVAMAFQTAMSDKIIDTAEGRRLLEMMQNAVKQEPAALDDSTTAITGDSTRLAPDSL